MLAGVALLLQELRLLALSWAVVRPGILMVVGAITMAAGAVGVHRSRRGPA